MIKVGQVVTHVDYPGQKGRVVAKTKRWPASPPIFLVKWPSGNLSRHIADALVTCKT